LWILNRKKALFKAIIFTNSVLTIGLLLNMVALSDVLVGLSPEVAEVLLVDVFFMAMTNILIFSIWYWIIDPPGVEEEQRVDEPWDFLFPQRENDLPFMKPGCRATPITCTSLLPPALPSVQRMSFRSQGAPRC
jgi:hypothetical protein